MTNVIGSASGYPLTESHKKMIEQLPSTQAKANRALREYERKMKERQARSWVHKLFVH